MKDIKLEKEFNYFVSHKDELLEKYNGKVLVIIGEEIVGVYNLEIEAYKESSKKYKLGTFLIQKCEPGEESYSVTYHTQRVVFS